MNYGEYCVNVCGGKCCKLWDENKKEVWRCPNQLPSGACAIFEEWKDKGTCGKYFAEIENTPMTIQEVLEKKLLPQWIEDQCCYKHPELLNGNRK